MLKPIQIKRSLNRKQRLMALAGLSGALLLLSACSDEPWIRDDYFGKSWLEPERIIQPIKRDPYGNPILEKKKPE